MENNEKEKEFLEEQFFKEIITNEKIRAALLALVSFWVFVTLIIYAAFFKDTINSSFNVTPLYFIIAVFGIIFIREFFIARLFLKKKFTVRRTLKPSYRYLNILIECTFPSLIILIIIFFWRNDAGLYSPVIMLYFIMIILSTLSLDFRISLFSGVVCAVEYWVIVFLIANNYESVIQLESLDVLFSFGKGMMFISSGVIAGIVAHQLRLRITKRFEVISERDKILNLFGQQVSQDIVYELLTQREELQSKRKFVCVMFLDIRGFTSFAEMLEPEEIIEYQNKVFGFMIDIVAKNYGIINQLLGDGLMATFGAPLSKGNDCQHAFDSAVEIIKELNKRIKNGEIPETHIGIGLHAGYVVAGNVGSDLRKQYSITGNTVILSSRIEELNKEYNSSLLISAEVYNAVSFDKYRLTPEMIGPVNVKGHKQPINIFKII